jgi:hypothetical protein
MPEAAEQVGRPQVLVVGREAATAVLAAALARLEQAVATLYHLTFLLQAVEAAEQVRI